MPTSRPWIRDDKSSICKNHKKINVVIEKSMKGHTLFVMNMVIFPLAGGKEEFRQQVASGFLGTKFNAVFAIITLLLSRGKLRQINDPET